MKVGKIIYMERREFNLLNDALNLLDQMSDDLEKLEEEDETVYDLSMDCKSAWGNLSDFIDTYNRQFVKPDDDELE